MVSVMMVLVRLEAGGRAPQPLLLELDHLVGKAHAFLADPVALRHPHLVEEDLRGVGRAHPHLVEFSRDLHALALHRHADQRLVAMLGAVAGIGEQADPVGLDAIGDPHLAAIDDVVVAVGARVGLDRGDIGAGARFRHADAGHRIARDRGRQKLAAHFIRAEPRQRRRRHIGLHPDRHRHPAAMDRAELFRHHQRVAVIEPLAAELDRLVEPEKAEAAELLEQLMRGKLLRLLPFIDERIDFRGDEFLQRVAGVVVFGGEEHFCYLLVIPPMRVTLPGGRASDARAPECGDGLSTRALFGSRDCRAPRR